MREGKIKVPWKISNSGDGILVRILQQKRTKESHLYKEMTYTVMEAKSQNLQSARLEIQENKQCSSSLSLKAWYTKWVDVVNLSWRKRENDVPAQAEQVPSSPSFCSIEVFSWGPSSLARMNCFMKSTNLNVNLIQKHPYRDTKNNVQNIKLTLRELWNDEAKREVPLARKCYWYMLSLSLWRHVRMTI